MPKSRKNKPRGRKSKSSQESRERQRKNAIRKKNLKYEEQLRKDMDFVKRQMGIDGGPGTVGTPVMCPKDYWKGKN